MIFRLFVIPQRSGGICFTGLPPIQVPTLADGSIVAKTGTSERLAVCFSAPHTLSSKRMPSTPQPEQNRLYYGDNLQVLREYIAHASVDLIYLDPPFNSRQDYNVLFAEKDGSR